jgi:aminoglycoside phosphotransferase (APT) family kinase protein
VSQPLEILSTLPGFSGARVRDRLEGGVTSRSFLVELGDALYVLRIDTPEARRLGLNRHAEREVCEAIAAAGLGPRPVLFDAERGIYLRRFVPGRAWTSADLDDPENLGRLARLLRRVHAVPPVGQPFDANAAARRYAAALGDERADALASRVGAAVASLEPDAPALCHNDLVAQNILQGETLQLIDWEFAGTGDRFFDLAVVVQHHGLADRRVDVFLHSYLDRPASESDYRRLQSQRDGYRALLELWTLRVSAMAAGRGQDSTR